MRVFISTGEASGDAYGAALVRELRRTMPDATFEGTGASRMEAEGVHLCANSSRWGAISITEALRVVPRVFLAYRRMRKTLASDPGLLIPVDFGYMNIRLARYAKAKGWRVLYFVPPGSWRRDRQGGDLPAVTDAIVTPFRWSAEILNGMGAHAHWFGHPIRQLLREANIPEAEHRIGLAVLPGSRHHEVASNLPILAESLADWPEPCEFAIAPGIDVERLSRQWVSLTCRTDDTFTTGHVYEVLSRRRCAVVCSGTATLEAALCHCPMVVMYQLNPTMRREARLIRMRRPKYIALPNILLDRPVVPEFVGEELTAKVLRNALDQVAANPEPQHAAFRELEAVLGPSDAITQTAELAAKLAS